MASVAVVGAGAIGSYYGARLAEAGHDVRFLLRSDYDAVAAGGLHVASPLGDMRLQSPRIGRTPAELAAMGPVDWLLLGLKATALPALPDLAGPLISDGTRVIAILNGLDIEEQVSALLPGCEVFAGLGFIGVRRGEPGRIIHEEFGALNIAHYGDDPAELERARALFEGSKVETPTAPNRLRARWEKLGWNIPFNGLCVLAGGVAVDRIARDAAMWETARRAMREVIAAGNADLSAQGHVDRIDGAALAERYETMTQGMGPYRPSTAIDHAEGRPLEVDAIFATPANRAAALGIDAPTMSLFASLIRSLGDPR